MQQQDHNNILLVYISLFAPRMDAAKNPIPPKQVTYQIEGGNGTVSGFQTNEAVLRFLARDPDAKLDKIIAFCSDSVCKNPCAMGAYDSTLDYIQNGVLPELNFAADALQVIRVPDQMDNAARNGIIREVAQLLKPNDDLYIDLSGGMRDTAMLFVTIARYLQTISNVNTRQVYYAEMGKKPMLRNSTQLYDILDMISAVDLFFETGNITKLRNYLKCQETNTQAKILLEKIEMFSEDLALCQMAQIKNDLKAIAAALRQQDNTALDAFHQLLFELFSQRFEQTFQTLLDNRTESLPQLVSWCNKHQLYQQALTLISEQLPAFVCEHIFAQPTDLGFAYLQSQAQNNNKPWPYPLFHYHFNTLKNFGTETGYFKNLLLNKDQLDDGARPLCRPATQEQFHAYLMSITAKGFFAYDTAAKEKLAHANALYQQVLLYRNYTNHASKLPDTLIAVGVPQLSMQNIHKLLSDVSHCMQDIQTLKKVVPADVIERKVTQTIVYQRSEA